jgi:hypothetical protein
MNSQIKMLAFPILGGVGAVLGKSLYAAIAFSFWPKLGNTTIDYAPIVRSSFWAKSSLVALILGIALGISVALYQEKKFAAAARILTIVGGVILLYQVSLHLLPWYRGIETFRSQSVLTPEAWRNLTVATAFAIVIDILFLWSLLLFAAGVILSVKSRIRQSITAA